MPRRPAEDSDTDHPIADAVRYEEEEPDIDKEWTRAMAAFEILGYNFFEAERMARGAPGYVFLDRSFPEPSLPRYNIASEINFGQRMVSGGK